MSTSTTIRTAALGDSNALVARRDHRLTRVFFFATVLLACVAYANTLGFDLVYDDAAIFESPLLHEPWNVKAIFTNGFRPRRVDLYRPLFDWSLLANHRFNELVLGSGASGVGFHAVNVLLHAAASALFFVWMRSLALPSAVCAIAACLFAVHPIHSEAVANVTGRSEPMAAMFGFAFLMLWRRRSTALALASFLAAVWSKESALTFLPIALLADALFPCDVQRRSGWSYVACGGVAAVWYALRRVALTHAGPGWDRFMENPLVAASTLERVCTAAKIQLEYLRLLVLPIGLSTDYSFDQIPVVRGFEPVVALFVIVVGAAGAAAWMLRRRAPVVALAIAAYGLAFSITSNFVVPIGSIMAERLAYAPSAFFCLFVAYAAWTLARKRGEWALVAGVTPLVLALAGLTFAQNRTWKDQLTLFRDQVRTAPRSAKARFNLGSALSRARDTNGAIAAFEESERIDPAHPLTHLVLANELLRVPDPERSLAEYRAALKLAPDFVEARVFLAHALIDLGRIDEAKVEAREIRARQPKNAELDELDRLIADAIARGVRPKSDLDLARELSAEGDHRGAIECLERAVRNATTETERREAWTLLGDAYAAAGDHGRAEAARQSAAR
jgi:tetratricopeptide (TPR) repeat protein